MGTATMAQAFRALHVKGSPLVLYNAWDAGSAKAVAEAGAPAIATGSWSMAAAQGYPDGEALPLKNALDTVAQIAENVAVPVTMDFEGGYASDLETLKANVSQLIDTGVIGLNFEDRIVQGTGLHSVEVQAKRIAAIRAVADAKGVDFFINARTDLFFQGSKAPMADLLAQALERAAAYAEVGADGLFVPGLAELDDIAQICAAQELPVNIMRKKQDITALAEAGVARISHGPTPYLSAMKALTAAAQEFYS